jgi:hypothetical protein
MRGADDGERKITLYVISFIVFLYYRHYWRKEGSLKRIQPVKGTVNKLVN